MDIMAMQKMMEETSAEDRTKSMGEWGTWMKNHMADLADAGAPVGKNTQVTTSGSTDVSNDIGGYSIVQAETKEAAAKLFADNPHLSLPGAVVDLMEIVPMPA